MASVKLYLDKPNGNTDTTIFLRIFINGKRIKISTGESLHPKFWNPEKQEVRKTYDGATEFNRLLKEMVHTCSQILQSGKAEQLEITADFLKQKLQESFNKNKQEHSFYDCFEEFITSSKIVKKNGVILVYKALYKRLKEYEKLYNSPLTYEKIDFSFNDKFVNFLIGKCGFSNNTVGKHIKTLKTFLNWANQRGYNPKMEFKKFKVFQEESVTIYLTENELKIISNLDLSNNLVLSNVRDLFLLQCYTALRYSDISNLKEENIKIDKLALRTIKTKDSIDIPLSGPAKEVIQRLVYNKFHVISNQKMNQYIKEIGKLAGIDEPTQIITYQGSKRIENILPKYNLIGTHTGRRTFITLSLQKGMRPEIVMKISGHKDYRSFKKYIKLTDKIVSEELNDAWGR